MYPCDKCRVFIQQAKTYNTEEYYCRKCKTVSTPDDIFERFPTHLPKHLTFQRKCSPLKDSFDELDSAVDELVEKWLA